MNRFEERARALWLGWGDFRKFTVCDRCSEAVFCCAARRRGPWLCISCFDIGPEADFLARRNGDAG